MSHQQHHQTVQQWQELEEPETRAAETADEQKRTDSEDAEFVKHLEEKFPILKGW